MIEMAVYLLGDCFPSRDGPSLVPGLGSSPAGLPADLLAVGGISGLLLALQHRGRSEEVVKRGEEREQDESFPLCDNLLDLVLAFLLCCLDKSGSC